MAEVGKNLIWQKLATFTMECGLTTTLPLQYIVPDTNFQREVMDFTTNLPIQHSKTRKLSQTQPQLIEYATNLPFQNSNLSTLSQTQPQLMEYTSNLPTQYSNHVALVQPQSQRHKEYNMNAAINHSSHIPYSSSTQDDCEECSVTEYKKYNVDLPFVRGLPDNIVFTCTLCQTNFDTEKSLQRHMKNIHDAFKQDKKGIKRKLKQRKVSIKKVKATDEVVPYSMYVLKNLTYIS